MTCNAKISWCVFPDRQNPGTKLWQLMINTWQIYDKYITWKTEISWCVFPDCQNPGTKLMGRNVCLHSGSACCFLYLDKSYNVWADFLFLSISWTYSSLSYVLPSLYYIHNPWSSHIPSFGQILLRIGIFPHPIIKLILVTTFQLTFFNSSILARLFRPLPNVFWNWLKCARFCSICRGWAKHCQRNKPAQEVVSLVENFHFTKTFFVDFDRLQFKGAWLSCSFLLPPSFQEYSQDISKISSRYPQGEIYKIPSSQSL